MPKRIHFALFLVLLVPVSACAGGSRSGPEANIRPCFNTGYTSPGGRPYDGGYGLGMGFEAERSPALGLLFRVEWDWLTREPRMRPFDYYSPPYSPDLVTFTWSVGARGYLRSGATLRPYGELDVGVRLGGEKEESGTVLIPRAGITIASSGSAGLLLECGANFTTHDPKRFLFVPIRFGVVFP